VSERRAGGGETGRSGGWPCGGGGQSLACGGCVPLACAGRRRRQWGEGVGEISGRGGRHRWRGPLRGATLPAAWGAEQVYRAC
jgi:hypothetical protein